MAYFFIGAALAARSPGFVSAAKSVVFGGYGGWGAARVGRADLGFRFRHQKRGLCGYGGVRRCGASDGG